MEKTLSLSDVSDYGVPDGLCSAQMVQDRVSQSPLRLESVQPAMLHSSNPLLLVPPEEFRKEGMLQHVLAMLPGE